MTDSDITFVKINLPANSDFTKNGVGFSLDDAIVWASALPEVNGNKFLTLAVLCQTLEDNDLISETIGKYIYVRGQKMTRSDRWRLEAASASFGSVPPNVLLRNPMPGFVGRCY